MTGSGPSQPELSAATDLRAADHARRQAEATDRQLPRDSSEVSRVLLLYSGGLDTSVMLKWIQDQYGAEVVALTVNLGQPGEDYEVIRGKAMHLGADPRPLIEAKDQRVEE